jgi:uncharacterized phage-associated protein
MSTKVKTSKHTAYDVALYFISISNEKVMGITNKKLQKLVYYAQAWFLAVFDEKLFDDSIEAWVHGPAVPSLYRKFKMFTYNYITLDTSSVKFNFDKNELGLLENIWNVYGKYDAEYLEALTHSETPWQSARIGLELGDISKNVIDLDIMKNYYAQKLK